jgi:2-oxoglutarate ferredoxin oxidoreductase subunit gamma
MKASRLNVRFCGFGGQGIVLAAIIFGTTSVKKAGLNAVQMQSYGSEARGGECQAEIIVSKDSIESPLADKMDILVVMSQPALDKFMPTLKDGGVLIYDPAFVNPPNGRGITGMAVPATRVADTIGVKLAANMVMLGFLQGLLDIFTPEDLLEIIGESVPQKYLDANLQAARNGMELAAGKTDINIG